MTAQYWCELAWLGGSGAAEGVVITIDGDRITEVRAGVPACPPEAVPLAGLTLPALANAHSHAFHRALRGRTHAGRGNFWMWRDLMYRVAARLDPDCYYRLARAVFAEMALAGIGIVGEFHYVHHRPGGGNYDDPDAMGAAVVAAARDAGIRLTLLDTLYLHGGLDPSLDGGYEPLRPSQTRFSDGSADRWADRVEGLASTVSGPMVRVGAAVHSVRAVDPPSIKVAADWAKERGAPLHFHASEQLAENRQCLGVHGLTPIDVIAQAEGLGPGTTLVHATHADGRDQAMIGAAGAYCCLCPSTERDLADGTGPSVGLAQSGAGLCLGSDSHATVDILSEARTVELDQRAATGDRGVFDVDALASMATSGGYRSVGWPEGGTLESGALADFATVGLDSVRMAGADAATALAATIFAATSADVHHLVVGGRTVVRDGQHTTIDVAADLASAITEVTAP
ncbi:formimidoylglutamate deiminase [Candidatus Poriferisodalis sp.]|uniref:formimidoylglutamate deiminase n=1 Tax=Candidatus Poriferisodalis sp. TaxID=3101277 RepID=UPI003B5A4B95